MSIVKALNEVCGGLNKTLNKWEEVFESFLDLTEFSLVHYKDGKISGNDESTVGHWSLYDRQGGNLGNIEGDVFENAEDIFCRMGVYIDDYYYRDLEEEAENYEICAPSDDTLAEKYGEEVYWKGTAYWLAIKSELGADHLFIKDHSHEFDVMDMIANHYQDIDLNNIQHEEA